MNKTVDVLNKKRGFSLVELLITIVIVGILAAGFVPVLIKRANRSNDPDCPGGSKLIRQVFYYNQSTPTQSFTIPEDISSGVTFTLVSGGAGGASASRAAGEVFNTSACGLPVLSNQKQFYTNVVYDAVRAGSPASCAAGKAGDSGKYISGFGLNIKKKCGPNCFSQTITSGGCTVNNDASCPMSWSSEVGGDENTNKTTKYLKGGVPNVNITYQNKRRGMGGSCILSSNGSSYNVDTSALNTGAACRVSYNTATLGDGGASGIYVKFELALAEGDSCNIVVGRGGAAGQNGENTTVQCDSNGPVYTTASQNSFPQGAAYRASQQAEAPDSNTISGGSGGIMGNVKKALGGCYGADSSASCSNPNGENGAIGSGGGGGSCNEAGCGMGGKGGDGLAIVEYKVQCK